MRAEKRQKNSNNTLLKLRSNSLEKKSHWSKANRYIIPIVNIIKINLPVNLIYLTKK